MLPWSSIRDDQESARYAGGWSNPRAMAYGLARTARGFAYRPDAGQPCHVEVHVEAAGMLPRVARVALPLGASVYSTGGFSGVTVKYKTARRIARRYDDERRPTVVLCVGDYDPSGIALYASFKEDVLRMVDEGTEFLGYEWGGEGTCRFGYERGSNQFDVEAPLFRRIAVTPEQIRAHDLPTAPAKKTDRRGDWSGDTVQCEALPSALFMDIVRDAILEHQDEDLRNEVEADGDAIGDRMGPLYDRIVQSEAMSELLDEHRDNVDGWSSDIDWTGGYHNDDDDDMEQGV